MTTLRLLIAHADSDPLLLGRFRHELEGAASVDLTTFVAPPVPGIPGGGLSSRYDALATQLRRDGRILPSLRARYPETTRAELFVLVTYSSGFKLAQRILESPADRDALDGWIALDGLHTGFDPDGTANDAQLAAYVDFAQLAADGRKLCWIGHSDVQTPQQGPSAYASTTQTATELRRLVGESRGLFNVEAYNLRDAAHQREEHGQALWGWGPVFVGRAVRALLAARGDRSVGIPWRDPALTLGERCVLWSLDQAEHVFEEPAGSNNGASIREYFAPAYRYSTGKLLAELGVTHGNWCVVAGCAAARACVLPGETIPHPYCASGYEIEQALRDQKERSALRSPELVRAGKWAPMIGDAVLFDRDDPTVRGDEWQRHFARVLRWRPDGSFRTIGANEGNQWRETEHHIDDRDLSGPRRAVKAFIEYPRK